MPKATSAPREQRRHNPLHEELLEHGDGGHLRKVSRTKRRERQERGEEYVDSGMSQKILQLAKEQQDELQAEETASSALRGQNIFAGVAGQMRFEESDPETDEGEWEEYDADDDGVVEELEMNEEDEELFNRFMPGSAAEQRVSLADKILEKIAEHEAKVAGSGGNREEDEAPALPPKVIEVYTK